MYVTEKDAFGKWCCQARHEAVRQADRNVMVPCIGSACMAWRWKYAFSKTSTKLLGTCGLASDPEIETHMSEICGTLCTIEEKLCKK